VRARTQIASPGGVGDQCRAGVHRHRLDVLAQPRRSPLGDGEHPVLMLPAQPGRETGVLRIRRGHDHLVAGVGGHVGQHGQAGRVDAVVIGDQYPHGGWAPWCGGSVPAPGRRPDPILPARTTGGALGSSRGCPPDLARVPSRPHAGALMAVIHANRNHRRTLVEQMDAAEWSGDNGDMYEVTKSDEQWQAELDPLEYQVLRHAATERPGTGELLHEDRVGVYHCRACGAELFRSTTKFEAHYGWPSFYLTNES